MKVHECQTMILLKIFTNMLIKLHANMFLGDINFDCLTEEKSNMTYQI